MLREMDLRLKEAQAELAQHASIGQPAQTLRIQSERPMPGFQFNLTMIATSIELAKRVGFRAAADALKILFGMLKIDLKIPSHDAIEQWTLRLGVASLKNTFDQGQRVLWMADHSSQIGKERLLLIVGVALDDLPPPGETLTFDKMKVLAVVPGRTWKKEDVEREYLKLAQEIGVPVYLLCDGASELRDPAAKLEKDGEKTIVLGDLKHVAANILEKEIGRGERFKSFLKEVGLTRSRVQQTELDLFAPPKLRSKSRFMNLGKLFTWSTMVLHHLKHPDSEARSGIEADRMKEKLGWLLEYAEDLESWRQCQEVIDGCLGVINREGLDAGTAALVDQALEEQAPGWRDRDSSATRIAVQLVAWIERSAGELLPGERAWLSTELLESLFGCFKQMERQHSHGGFTRLIAALPTLCLTACRDQIRSAFSQTDSKATKMWIEKSLGKTLTARRNAAYQELKPKSCDHPITAA